MLINQINSQSGIRVKLIDRVPPQLPALKGHPQTETMINRSVVLFFFLNFAVIVIILQITNLKSHEIFFVTVPLSILSHTLHTVTPPQFSEPSIASSPAALPNLSVHRIFCSSNALHFVENFPSLHFHPSFAPKEAPSLPPPFLVPRPRSGPQPVVTVQHEPDAIDNGPGRAGPGFPNVRPQRRRADIEEGAERLVGEPGNIHSGRGADPDDREDRRQRRRLRRHRRVRGAVQVHHGRERRGGRHEGSVQRVRPERRRVHHV